MIKQGGCPVLKNGDVREFVDHIHYGDELWFLYDGKKYFLEGWYDNGHLDLYLYEMADNGKNMSGKAMPPIIPSMHSWKPKYGTENPSGMLSKTWNGWTIKQGGYCNNYH